MIKRLLKISATPSLHIYRGFGSPDQITIIGRVGEQVPERRTQKSFSIWYNLLIFVRSYLSRPLPDVSVQIWFGEVSTTVKTDREGLFFARFTPKPFQKSRGAEWHSAKAQIVGQDTLIEIPVLIEGEDNEFGVISDIDDTILISNATKKLKLLYATLFQSPETRKPFAGVVELFCKLRQGSTGTATNPVFYVSSSHWNLYELLVEFFALNNLPRGPLLLKSIGSFASLFTTLGNHSQKKESIELILQTFPRLPFILIGDSGQKDAEIYQKIAQEFPGRIKAIYIRDVTVHEDFLVKTAQMELQDKVPVVVAQSSDEIKKDARKRGYIT